MPRGGYSLPQAINLEKFYNMIKLIDSFGSDGCPSEVVRAVDTKGGDYRRYAKKLNLIDDCDKRRKVCLTENGKLLAKYLKNGDLEKVNLLIYQFLKDYIIQFNAMINILVSESRIYKDKLFEKLKMEMEKQHIGLDRRDFGSLISLSKSIGCIIKKGDEIYLRSENLVQDIVIRKFLQLMENKDLMETEEICKIILNDLKQTNDKLTLSQIYELIDQYVSSHKNFRFVSGVGTNIIDSDKALIMKTHGGE